MSVRWRKGVRERESKRGNENVGGMGSCTSIERRAAEAKIRHRRHRRQTRKGATLGLVGGGVDRPHPLTLLACKKCDKGICSREQGRSISPSFSFSFSFSSCRHYHHCCRCCSYYYYYYYCNYTLSSFTPIFLPLPFLLFSPSFFGGQADVTPRDV